MRFLTKLLLLLACLSAGTGSCFAQTESWKQRLDSVVALYGHRNWIVIADSAYPAQTRDGIETVVTGANYFEVLHAVLAKMDATTHVTPILWTDEELKYVPDADAPGSTAFRDRLTSTLHNRRVQTMNHEQLIRELDKAGQTFKVLILKTNLTIPYTSLFLQLDCGYWSPQAEERLRSAMSK